jgi:hypothetical protein
MAIRRRRMRNVRRCSGEVRAGRDCSGYDLCLALRGEGLVLMHVAAGV